MFRLDQGLKVYLHRAPVDFRLSVNGLAPLVQQALGLDPFTACANASANLYSLLQTCKVNGIDGYRYLRALLIALPNAKTADDHATLLPWRIDLTSVHC